MEVSLDQIAGLLERKCGQTLPLPAQAGGWGRTDEPPICLQMRGFAIRLGGGRMEEAISKIRHQAQKIKEKKYSYCTGGRKGPCCE